MGCASKDAARSPRAGLSGPSVPRRTAGARAASRKGSGLLLRESPHPVSDSANRLNQPLSLPRVDLLAQRVDVDVDDVRREIERVFPDPRLDLGSGNDFAPPAEEELEQGALARRQPNDVSRPRQLARFGIVVEIRKR